MYCCHCGKKIDEGKIEGKKFSASLYEGEVDENTKVEYVCPRCGHLIHHDVDEREIKTLAAASHAEIQRGRNFFANGMSLNCIGTIILVLAIIFLLLSRKPANNFQLVTTCPEFYVCVVCFVVSAVLIGFGLFFTIQGILKKVQYQALLKDIQNETFHQ